jgi:hypothetical protein
MNHPYDDLFVNLARRTIVSTNQMGLKVFEVTPAGVLTWYDFLIYRHRYLEERLAKQSKPLQK